MAGFLRKKFLDRNLQTEKAKRNILTSSDKEDNKIEWITFYRRNFNIYAERVLKIKLRPFQHFMLWLMCNSDVFMGICSRGISKSFVLALYCIIKALLYPYSEIVVTSSTVPQANKFVEEKMRDELIKKLSPYLQYMYQKEYLVINKADDIYKVEIVLNHSTIKVLPCLESARGSRATVLVYEEARLLKKTIIDSVFEKMAHPRQAMYMQDEKYSENKRWQEECQSMYITSARFKNEWFFNTFKNCVTGYYMDKRIKYNIFAADIFIAIENGLKTVGDYWKSYKMSSEIDFMCEDLNAMIGEGEDAFFSLKDFKDNQTLDKVFRPPTITDLYMETDLKNKPKKDNELRLVIVDYAFANTTTRQKNDQTVIQCVSAHWVKGHFERHWDYMECHEASDSLGAARRVRELKWDYDADYVIPDLRNGGETLLNALGEVWEHPERGALWNPHGFTVSTRNELHVVPEAKLQDLRTRAKDPEAIPCLIPVIGTPELNHLMWLELKKQLVIGACKFPVDSQQAEANLQDSGEYYQLSAEQLADRMIPYVEADSMIYEAVNLKSVWKGDRLKLEEPRSSTKDKAVVCSYGNYIISQLELQWSKAENEEDINIDDIQLVF